MTGLTKKELSRSLKELRADISTLVKGLDPIFKQHKTSCELLRAALKEYNAAKAAFEKKNSTKNANRLEKATTELRTAYGTYLDSAKALSDQNDKIILNYTKLIEIAEAVSDREERKAIDEREAYKSEYEIRLEKLERGTTDALPDVLAPEKAEESTAKEAETSDETEVAAADDTVSDEPETTTDPTPVRPAAGATVASVNVAPVTIDISAYVERAISATMDRLSAGMERKIDAYLASLEIPTPEIPAAPVAPVPAPVAPTAEGVDATEVEALATTVRANNELMSHLIEEQTHIYEKLRTMITNVQGTVDNMTELSAAYLALAEKERDAIEIQKQVNDMQRHTAREQQGVQVNQKMISEEQIAISAEQALLADRQKATMDKQASLLESQKAMEETQKALLEAHLALEEAMKSVMQSQKEIIATQQAIINGNAKNIDAQKSVIAKQAEVTAAQKEALAAHKQLLKEQKALNEKLTGKTAKPKKATNSDPDEPPAAAEPAVTDGETADAPDITALSADDEFRD